MSQPVNKENKTQEYRNVFVDLYKILLAVFVIFIHFPNYKVTADLVAICRVAVAGFAAITGFYIFKPNSTYEEKMEKAKKFLINSLKYFGIAAVFSFAAQLIYTWICGVPTVQGLKSFVFEIAPFLWKVRPALQVGTVFYQLWYMQGLVLVASVYLLIVWLKIDVVMFALPLLSLPIYWVQKKWPLTQNFNYQILYRNSWFMMLPGFAGGWIAGHFRKTNFKCFIYPILIVALGGFIYLQILVNRKYPIEMTFIAVIIASLTILLLDKIPRFPCKPFYWIFGTNYYTIIYFIHVFVGNMLNVKYNISTYWKPGLLILYTFLVALVIAQIMNLAKPGIKLLERKNKQFDLSK